MRTRFSGKIVGENQWNNSIDSATDQASYMVLDQKQFQLNLLQFPDFMGVRLCRLRTRMKVVSIAHVPHIERIPFFECRTID